MITEEETHSIIYRRRFSDLFGNHDHSETGRYVPEDLSGNGNGGDGMNNGSGVPPSTEQMINRKRYINYAQYARFRGKLRM